MKNEAPAAAQTETDAFASFVGTVRAAVEGRLGTWLDERVAEARRRGTDVGVVADAVRHLALRGGKRMRAALLAAAYDACAASGRTGRGADEAARARVVVPAAIALELLQAYLLVHDDLMDGDEMRRGGPSVPALMRAHFGESKGAAMSILAGDLASAWSQAALFEVEADADLVVAASRALARAHEAVVAGQILDVQGHARDAAEVEVMHALKTASYTVVAPVRMGALLSGALASQVAALDAFAEPLGIAFQLRDDVLGTFGQVRETGKPTGNDLREGKRSALIVQAMQDPETAVLLSGVLGRRDAPEADVRAAALRIDASGARARIEDRIASLRAQARAALDVPALASLGAEGRSLLSQAAGALTERRS